MSQVNLLPPEIRQRSKARQQVVAILLAGAAVVALLVVWFLILNVQLSQVNADLAAQEATAVQQGKIQRGQRTCLRQVCRVIRQIGFGVDFAFAIGPKSLLSGRQLRKLDIIDARDGLQKVGQVALERETRQERVAALADVQNAAHTGGLQRREELLRRPAGGTDGVEVDHGRPPVMP